MNTKTSDNILYIILMFVGVGIYALCVYLSFAFLRIGMLCNELGGIYSLGAVFSVIAFMLPLFCVFLFDSDCYFLDSALRFLCKKK